MRNNRTRFAFLISLLLTVSAVMLPTSTTAQSAQKTATVTGIDNDIYLWLDASQITQTDGSSISEWRNTKFPALSALTQSTTNQQPTFVRNAHNYLPAVRFSGGQFLQGMPDVQLQGVTVFYIARSANNLPANRHNTLLSIDNDLDNTRVGSATETGGVTTINGFELYVTGSNTGSNPDYKSYNTNLRIPDVASGMVTDSTTSFGSLVSNYSSLQGFVLPASNTMNAAYYAGGTFDGATSPFSNSSYGIGGVSVALDIQRVALGASLQSSSVVAPFEGEVFEVIIFEGELDDNERQRILSYFHVKYGFDISPSFYSVPAARNVTGNGALDLHTPASFVQFKNDSYRDIAVIGRDDDFGLHKKQTSAVYAYRDSTQRMNGATRDDFILSLFALQADNANNLQILKNNSVLSVKRQNTFLDEQVHTAFSAVSSLGSNTCVTDLGERFTVNKIVEGNANSVDRISSGSGAVPVYFYYKISDQLSAANPAATNVGLSAGTDYTRYYLFIDTDGDGDFNTSTSTVRVVSATAYQNGYLEFIIDGFDLDGSGQDVFMLASTPPEPNPPVVVSESGLANVCPGSILTLTVSDSSKLQYTLISWYIDGVRVSEGVELGVQHSAISTSGTSQIRVDGTNACSVNSVTSLPFAVNALPYAPNPVFGPNPPLAGTASTSALCDGTAFTLNVSNDSAFDSYRWYRNGSMLSVNQANYTFSEEGYYEVVGYDIHGCSSANAGAYTIVYTALPTDVIIVSNSGNEYVCDNNGGNDFLSLSPMFYDGTTSMTIDPVLFNAYYNASNATATFSAIARTSGGLYEELQTSAGMYIYTVVEKSTGCTVTSSPFEVKSPSSSFMITDTFVNNQPLGGTGTWCFATSTRRWQTPIYSKIQTYTFIGYDNEGNRKTMSATPADVAANMNNTYQVFREGSYSIVWDLTYAGDPTQSCPVTSTYNFMPVIVDSPAINGLTDTKDNSFTGSVFNAAERICNLTNVYTLTTDNSVYTNVQWYRRPMATATSTANLLGSSVIAASSYPYGYYYATAIHSMTGCPVFSGHLGVLFDKPLSQPVILDDYAESVCDVLNISLATLVIDLSLSPSVYTWTYVSDSGVSSTLPMSSINSMTGLYEATSTYTGRYYFSASNACGIVSSTWSGRKEVLFTPSSIPSYTVVSDAMQASGVYQLCANDQLILNLTNYNSATNYTYRLYNSARSWYRTVTSNLPQITIEQYSNAGVNDYFIEVGPYASNMTVANVYCSTSTVETISVLYYTIPEPVISIAGSTETDVAYCHTGDRIFTLTVDNNTLNTTSTYAWVRSLDVASTSTQTLYTGMKGVLPENVGVLSSSYDRRTGAGTTFDDDFVDVYELYTYFMVPAIASKTCFVKSNPIKARIYPTPVSESLSSPNFALNQTITLCSEDTERLNATVVNLYEVGLPLYYNYQRSIDDVNYANVSVGSLSNTYDASELVGGLLVETYYYRFTSEYRYNDGTTCASTPSTATTIVYYPTPRQPMLSVSPSNISCENTTITITSNNVVANDTVTWYSGSSSVTVTSGVSMVGFNSSYNNATIRVQVTGDQGCQSEFSQDELLQFIGGSNNVTYTASIASKTICEGESIDLLLTEASNASYQWVKDGTEIMTATLSSYTTNTPGTYRGVVSIGSMCSSTTEDIVIEQRSLPAKPSISLLTASSTVCFGDSFSFNTDATGSFFWAYNAGTGEMRFDSASSTNNLTVDTNSYPLSARYYVASINEFSCVNRSDEIIILVNPTYSKPTITSSVSTVCEFMDVELGLESFTAFRYEWYEANTTPRSILSTSSVLTVSTGGNYAVSVITNDGCVTDSDAYAVTVYAAPALPVLSSAAYPNGVICNTIDGSPQYVTLSFGDDMNSSVTYTLWMGSNVVQSGIITSVNVDGYRTGTQLQPSMDTYVAQAENSSSCKSMMSLPFTVTINPRPVFAYIDYGAISSSLDTYVCNNTPLDLQVVSDYNLAYSVLYRDGMMVAGNNTGVSVGNLNLVTYPDYPSFEASIASFTPYSNATYSWVLANSGQYTALVVNKYGCDLSTELSRDIFVFNPNAGTFAIELGQSSADICEANNASTTLNITPAIELSASAFSDRWYIHNSSAGNLLSSNVLSISVSFSDLGIPDISIHTITRYISEITLNDGINSCMQTIEQNITYRPSPDQYTFTFTGIASVLHTSVILEGDALDVVLGIDPASPGGGNVDMFTLLLNGNSYDSFAGTQNYASLAQAGTYQIMAVSEYGCSSLSAPFTVSVIDLTPPQISVNANTACPGDIYTVTIDNFDNIYRSNDHIIYQILAYKTVNGERQEFIIPGFVREFTISSNEQGGSSNAEDIYIVLLYTTRVPPGAIDLTTQTSNEVTQAVAEKIELDFVSDSPYLESDNRTFYVDKGHELRIFASSDNAVNYVWESSSWPSSMTGKSILIDHDLSKQLPKESTILVVGEDAFGCKTGANDYVLKVVSYDNFNVLPYSGDRRTYFLTPDGSGTFDAITFFNTDLYNRNKVEIYDSTGNLVWERLNFDSSRGDSWAGQDLNNNDVVSGVYYYKINFPGGIGVVRGTINVVREDK